MNNIQGISAPSENSVSQLRVVFMGTPEFAVPCLESLLRNGVNVVSVITAPDKPQGRGRKITYSPVKECALQHSIRVLQPANLKSPGFLEELKSLQADLQVVVAFRMLPESVWAMPRLGTINLHASLLPQYRGAAPINWAIMNGEKETGVTTFFLRQDIDTGSIILQEKEPISPDDNAGTLYERLMHKGAGLVLRTVQAIASGDYTTTPQPDAGIKHAPKIFRETCEIHWDRHGEDIRNFVRGLSPYPGAWTVIDGRMFKVFKVSVRQVDGALKNPGEWITDNKNYLYVQSRDGWISIEELQPEGKKKMPIEEYFRGNKLSPK